MTFEQELDTDDSRHLPVNRWRPSQPIRAGCNLQVPARAGVLVLESAETGVRAKLVGDLRLAQRAIDDQLPAAHEKDPAAFAADVEARPLEQVGRMPPDSNWKMPLVSPRASSE